jgi:hypothetical protein
MDTSGPITMVASTSVMGTPGARNTTQRNTMLGMERVKLDAEPSSAPLNRSCYRRAGTRQGSGFGGERGERQWKVDRPSRHEERKK